MSALARILFAASRWAASTALIAMVVIVVAEIIARNVFGVSLQLSEEVAGYLLVAVCFLGFAASYRGGDLMRIDMIRELLPEALRRGIDVVFDVAALAAVLVVDYFAARFVISSYNRGMLAPTLLETPLWIPQLFIPLGLTVLALALLCRLLSIAEEAA